MSMCYFNESFDKHVYLCIAAFDLTSNSTNTNRDNIFEGQILGIKTVKMVRVVVLSVFRFGPTPTGDVLHF